jgi:hypothetical protein
MGGSQRLSDVTGCLPLTFTGSIAKDEILFARRGSLNLRNRPENNTPRTSQISSRLAEICYVFSY